MSHAGTSAFPGGTGTARPEDANGAEPLDAAKFCLSMVVSNQEGNR